MTERETNNSASVPRIGVSACLAGQDVRYDGGNKYQPLIDQHLTPYLNLQPFCPEMAANMGVPRPPIELLKIDNTVFALGRENRQLDATPLLHQSSHQFLKNQQFLNGFILKSRSPSCGFGSTPIHDERGNIIDKGNGIFAEQLHRQFPGIPIIEESWLNSGWRCRLFVACCQLAKSLPFGSEQPPLNNSNMTVEGPRDIFDNLLALTQSEAKDFIASVAID